jgi:hypothetical protein
LVYDIPHGKTIHHYRRKWNEGEFKVFDFTTTVARTQLDNQNAEEEGVFISQAALDAKKTSSKKILSLPNSNNDDKKFKFYLNPKTIGTYLVFIDTNQNNIYLFNFKNKNNGKIIKIKK